MFYDNWKRDSICITRQHKPLRVDNESFDNDYVLYICVFLAKTSQTFLHNNDITFLINVIFTVLRLIMPMLVVIVKKCLTKVSYHVYKSSNIFTIKINEKNKIQRLQFHFFFLYVLNPVFIKQLWQAARSSDMETLKFNKFVNTFTTTAFDNDYVVCIKFGVLVRKLHRLFFLMTMICFLIIFN